MEITNEMPEQGLPEVDSLMYHINSGNCPLKEQEGDEKGHVLDSSHSYLSRSPPSKASGTSSGLMPPVRRGQNDDRKIN